MPGAFKGRFLYDDCINVFFNFVCIITSGIIVNWYGKVPEIRTVFSIICQYYGWKRNMI